MDLRRVRATDWGAGLFGAALVGLLWAPWYKGSNAWQAMAINDAIFCIAGLLGVWLLIAAAVSSTQAVPIAAAAFATLAGLLASILAVIRLIWPPDLGLGPTERAAGVWLGTAAAIGLTACALASMRSEQRTASEEVDIPVTDLPAPSA